jgi:hypothetical protein
LNKSYIAVCSLICVCLSFTPVAFCSDLTGQVGGPSGPVGGAQVTVTDASGKVVGQGTTNDAGRYCITGIDPGTYKTTVNPPGGFQPGATNSSIPTEGLTEDWSLSPTVVASSSQNSPGTCGAALLGGPVLFGVAGLLFETGAGFGACAAAGCFDGNSSGGGSQPSSASK